jgi:glycosyltransferase involved in cell wall biosynthesis
MGVPVRVLFIHQNFPGQFRHLAPALARAGHEVRAIAISPRAELPGVTVHRYAVSRGNGQGVHPWAVDFETKTIRAEACARKLVELRTAGFVPDVVVGHPGWGETWLVKEVFRTARVLAFQEFYYGADVGFDPEFPGAGEEGRWRTRLKNANILFGLDTMDWGLSPTRWQAAQFPQHYQERISVVFDGIDTDVVSPGRKRSLSLGAPAVTFTPADEIVTFVNRNFEPYRGFHTFMRALPRLLELRPRARVVLVGGEERGYGSVPDKGTWREQFLAEVRERIDLSRVHFVGKVSHDVLVDLYRMASCHVYLTYPFVLSWSMIEAMSAGALVIGSRTAPVEEVITDGENGILVDFFDHEALACKIALVLAGGARFDPLRAAARRTVVERYALHPICLPRQLGLVSALGEGRDPPRF